MKKLLLSCAALALLASSSSAQSWGGAMWIWDEANANQVPQSDDPRFLRLTFDLAGKVEKAELWVTADNLYTAYVNGAKVGQGDDWAKVQKYDVAKHLAQGKNVLAIRAQNQGGVAGTIARLHIRTADKKDHFIVTDQRTKITQTEAKGWNEVKFDDSSWFAAIVLGEPGVGPWNLAGGPAGKGKTQPGGYGINVVDAKITKPIAAEEQKKHFIVPEGFEIELVFADPIVINPITLAMDEKGRLFVSESHTYRYGPPGSPIKPFANPVVRLDPTPDGKYKRTLVADGFADPVMGIAIKGDKLWLTANNYLYQYDLTETAADPKAGIAINRKTILLDKNKAWNPFGMFVLEWGPDGKLYMSVGDHTIDIRGPDGGTISGKRNSGIVMRMNPDGTKMERLANGFRVPYSFEYDPFGQLWLLSNGEGNPDRFARILDSVDYHCYSRPGISNEWLAGRHPLAPPVEEVHGGAHTQLMRYFAAAYPAEYQGNLFTCNWGRHGFAGANRGIFRYVLDERNNVVKKDTLVSCADPHFRPSHIHLDVDGSLLINDWYGRDDESDMTGRIWRLKYVGKNRPEVKHSLDSPEWKNIDYAISALGSPNHLIREKALNEVIKSANVDKLAKHAAKAAEPLGAANALWALLRIGTKDSKSGLMNGQDHLDWRVRRLTANIIVRKQFARDELAPHPFRCMEHLALDDADLAVRLEATIGLINRGDYDCHSLVVALQKGAAADKHLRYEAAWNVGKYADLKSLNQLLTSDDENVRLAGLIAIDVACYEEFPTKKVALEALAQALEAPGKLDQQLLLTLAQFHGDATILPALQKLIARDDVPLSTTAKAILVLKAKAGGQAKGLSAAAGKRLIEAVEKGAIQISTPADQLMLFEFLESEGPTPFALKQIGGQLRSPNLALRQTAHVLARKFGPASASLSGQLWPVILASNTKFDEAVEMLSTVARIEGQPSKERWEKLLAHPDPLVRTEAVRWWRNFKGNSDMVDLLIGRAPELLKQDAGLGDDLTSVLTHLGKTEQIKTLNLPEPNTDKESLSKYAPNAFGNLPEAEKKKRAALGLQVFERNACTKCHTTATQTTLLAPSLKGVGTQKVDYLVESVIFPSKIIKTGWETETVTLNSGKVLTGLVKEDGDFIRVLNLDLERRIAKKDIDGRAVSRVSIMPEGQEQVLSRREFVDLIAYLATLK